MSDFHYLDKIPTAEIFVDEDQVLLTQSMFGLLAEYSSTLPTGPSPGRIYRKNTRWFAPTSQISDWRIVICEPDDKPGWVLHRPRRPVIATPAQIRSARIESLLQEATL